MMNLIENLKNNHSARLKAGLFVGVVLFIGVIWYAVASLSPDNAPPLISLPKSNQSATPTPVRAEMYTQPLTVETSVGRRFDVNIVIDAKNMVINGIDGVISYDPTMVRVVQVTAPTEQDGSFNLLRRQNEDDKVYITSVKSEVNEIPTGELTVARLSIQALKPGTTNLTFEHQPGTTMGSTVIQTQDSKNILDKVTNTTIVIE